MLYIKARDTQEDTDVTACVTDLDALIHADGNKNIFVEDNAGNQYSVAKCHIEFLEIIE